MNVDAQTDTDGILSCEMHSNDLKDELTVISYVLVRFKSYGVPPGTRLLVVWLQKSIFFLGGLRLWNFSTGGKATEWSTFLKTGPPKRIYIYIFPVF